MTNCDPSDPRLEREAAISWEIVDEHGHTVSNGAWDSADPGQIAGRVVELLCQMDDAKGDNYASLRIEVEG